MLDSDAIVGVENSTTTIYFMPHCPSILYSRIVADAWGSGLSRVVIIGNRLVDVL